ncbi:MAG: tetraacyldisaccharide 4'-kinase [Alphaproteobacteria bacterium]|nr:tetraacyldisaccharide 4'-kinase [Alphaproteobacteria bacterium]
MPGLLQPAARAYAALGAVRHALATPYRAAVPVICVGNVVAGGAGKTPVVESLLDLLAARGRHPAVLSRGYGGRERGPVQVDAAAHGARAVGDEPLMLSRLAPVWVARDRAAAARAAVAAGADCLLMDDGFQNPGLAKDLSLLVIDGAYGLGNGQVMPAGPLREPAARALARADAVVVIGEAADNLGPRITKPVLPAALAPVNAADFEGRRVVAFAGIGRPEKFFATLEACGARLVARHGFPDHHAYSESDLRSLADAASASAATLVTTLKDRTRMDRAWRHRIAALAVTIAWHDEAALLRLLDAALRGNQEHGDARRG